MAMGARDHGSEQPGVFTERDLVRSIGRGDDPAPSTWPSI